jgi:hypothetical protein
VIPAPVPLGHLVKMTDGRGMFEHARYDVSVRRHGYCLDDVARALIVVAREDGHSEIAAVLADQYLAFVDSAIDEDGRARNRMDAEGRWTDAPDVGDWWGRAVWGLGVAATASSDPQRRARARTAFHRAARATSPHLRAMAFAAIGAAAMLAAHPDELFARGLLRRCAERISAAHSTVWDWPEDRLRYANGILPEALIAAGSALGDRALVERGLHLLDLLLDVETRDGRLSVAPTGGRGPGETGPAFDQQPIEVAAIAEACARAYAETGHERWADAVDLAWAWFEGRNDSGAVMFDPDTGAGYDGLTPTGRNENRGAESTLAALSTLQCAERCRAEPVAAVGSPAQTRSGDGGMSSRSAPAPRDP